MASRPLSDLWRIKPVDLILKQSGNQEHGLKRTLTAFSISLLGIGAIVGTGIFVLTGVAASQYAGPGLIFSFVLAGVVSGLAAICYENLPAPSLLQEVHTRIPMQRSAS